MTKCAQCGGPPPKERSKFAGAMKYCSARCRLAGAKKKQSAHYQKTYNRNRWQRARILRGIYQGQTIWVDTKGRGVMDSEGNYCRRVSMARESCQKRIFLVMADVELLAEFTDSAPLDPCLSPVRAFFKSAPRRALNPRNQNAVPRGIANGG
jgi:hypothetical protein